MSMKVWQASLAGRAASTRDKYRFFFEKFVKCAGLTADELRDMKYLEDQRAKPWERNQVENLLRQYIQKLEGEGYTCNTQKLAYAAVRSFFEAQGMPLFLKRQDRPVGCAFGSKVLTREEIRRLKNATEYLRDKALIIFLKDSGLRLSDVARLRWRDLKDYGEGFMGFEVETKKKKTRARGFVGPETTEMLELYKEKRLRGTEKIPAEEGLEEHPVFALLTDPARPLQPRVMSAFLSKIIGLAGVEGATPHGLRKFWEQNMHVEKIAYQKQMNGRALTDIERAYYWKETPALLEMYKQNYRNLQVEGEDFREVEERIRRDYEREIKMLKNRIYELKQRLNSYVLTGDQVAELLRRIEKLEKQAKSS